MWPVRRSQPLHVYIYIHIYTGTNTILITVTISAESIFFFDMQFEMNKFWKFGYLKCFGFLFPPWLQQHVRTCHLSVLLLSFIND